MVGNAVMQAPEEHIESIAEALGEMFADERLRGELIARGRTRCSLFTWERTAQATLASYRRALGEAPARSG